ncbi:SPW repeat-containing protein [Raineyella antarctica]|uniref:SPW repeat-containing protein n=1 Tax=Raineyella antarctica TaxID=1577474 RepID=A0A1G6GJ22_9ACTN|nr:SPW repeat protein [Raineyella antarctica]SDB81745.1 SPW repeat-containing protein [Raineyella antarctica]
MSTRQPLVRHPVAGRIARRHWEDWITIVAGFALALTPLWSPSDRSIWIVPFGLALVLLAAWSDLWEKVSRFAEELVVLAGVVILATPWIFGFAGANALALTAWAVGLVVIVMALVQMSTTRRSTRRTTLRRTGARARHAAS